ncbi:MAG: SCO family protein [Bacteroidales bacterium]
MKRKFLILIILFPGIILGQSLNNPIQEIGIYEHLNSTIPLDAEFRNQDSSIVKLSELINKPTVLSFVYYECPGLCSPLLDGIAELIDKSDMVLGVDYQVITISFNDKDTPKLGKKKKKNYVHSIKKKIDEDAWIWLTGDSVNIEKITDAAGFKYKRDGKDFLHPASIIAISPHGKISRYLYGTEFLPFDVKMAMIEASEEKSSPTINKLLKFCYSYDPASKKYMFKITSLSGGLIILLVLVFLFTVLLKKKPIKISKL